ncbi:MAG: hypothetical protein KatS3mg019_0314 [Fimbriimonadales bacterium]|nr:MAG: hypothetical protein KatS3mg019_0314 [Fimbriimonadales bacterium]
MKQDSRMQPNSLPKCLSGECGCLVAPELRRFYETSTSAEALNPDLTELVSRIFDCLRVLVQRQAITSPEDLGVALGAVFDLCMSLLYAERCTHTQWLYCPQEPIASFYPYMQSCPRCGRITDLPTVAHKPASDSIGRYASLCLAAILAEICQRTRIGWHVRLLVSGRGEIDILLLCDELVVLCELKASPLTAFPICVFYEEPLTIEVDGEPQEVITHKATDVPTWKTQPLCLYLFGSGKTLPLHAKVRDGKVSLIPSLLSREQDQLVEDIKAINEVWSQMFMGYESRWSKAGHLRWFTFGCGGGVDDSKNAPGLDRTDDIKKGLYQSLKLAEDYRTRCARRCVRVALLSNMHPVVHYTKYLQGFEDALWTHEAKLAEDKSDPEWRRVRASDLSPFYDMLWTLTKSWFRCETLKYAFSLQRLYSALGGQR